MMGYSYVTKRLNRLTKQKAPTQTRTVHIARIRHIGLQH